MGRRTRETHYKGTGPGRVLTITQLMADSLPEAFTASQLAKIIGVSRTSVHEWLKAGHFQSFFQEQGVFAGSAIIDRFDFLHWAKATGRFSGQIRDVEWLKQSGHWNYEQNEPTREWLEKNGNGGLEPDPVESADNQIASSLRAQALNTQRGESHETEALP